MDCSSDTHLKIDVMRQVIAVLNCTTHRTVRVGGEISSSSSSNSDISTSDHREDQLLLPALLVTFMPIAMHILHSVICLLILSRLYLSLTNINAGQRCCRESKNPKLPLCK